MNMIADTENDIIWECPEPFNDPEMRLTRTGLRWIRDYRAAINHFLKRGTEREDHRDLVAAFPRLTKFEQLRAWGCLTYAGVKELEFAKIAHRDLAADMLNLFGVPMDEEELSSQTAISRRPAATRPGRDAGPEEWAAWMQETGMPVFQAWVSWDMGQKNNNRRFVMDPETGTYVPDGTQAHPMGTWASPDNEQVFSLIKTELAE